MSLRTAVKTVYYAHCQDIYNTPQEARDLETLLKLNFLVDNPNGEANRRDFEAYQANHVGGDTMNFFRLLIDRCDCLCFRGLPGGAIPAGVQAEVAHALLKGLPVFELPSFSHRQHLSVEETRTYLREVGQR